MKANPRSDYGILLPVLTSLVLAIGASERVLAQDWPPAPLPGSFADDGVAAYAEWLVAGSEIEQLPGFALAIVSREEVLALHTWGVRDQRSQQPVDAESVFRIASMSKTFAGTVAAMVVEQDRLQSWDTPIREILPQIQIGTAASSSDISLRNILSHTTGLMPHAYSNMLDAGVAYDKIREKFNEIPTVCRPGQCYGYQNVVFSLVAEVVERSTRQDYEQYLDARLFEPLGMRQASTGLAAFEANADHATPHRRNGGLWQATTNNPAYYTVAPAAGINASISDMAIWARANLGAFPEVLSPLLLQATHEPVVETPEGNYFNRWSGIEHAYYATGWRVFDYRGMRVIHHGGGVRGFRAEMALVPGKNLGVVVLFNAETRFANDIVPAFLDMLVN